jgi:hypothetical protein
VLEDALARLEAQVQAVEGGVALLQFVDHAQRLQVVLEAAVGPHAVVQRVLPGVAERRVAEVVRQRDGLDQVLVERRSAARCERADLRHLERVRQPGAEQVALVVDEDLRLVLEPAERGAVDDAVAVALEVAARRRRRLGMAAARASRAASARSIRRQPAGKRRRSYVAARGQRLARARLFRHRRAARRGRCAPAR